MNETSLDELGRNHEFSHTRTRYFEPDGAVFLSPGRQILDRRLDRKVQKCADCLVCHCNVEPICRRNVQPAQLDWRSQPRSVATVAKAQRSAEGQYGSDFSLLPM